MSALRLIHARIVTPGRIIPDGAVDVSNGMVTAVAAASEAGSFAGEVVDLEGRTLLPGFVDIHCHGRNGADFSDGSSEAFATIGQHKLEEGMGAVYKENYQVYPISFTSGSSNITTVKTDAANSAIFNLQGQRVNKAAKGLYIVNGKKVVK